MFSVTKWVVRKSKKWDQYNPHLTGDSTTWLVWEAEATRFLFRSARTSCTTFDWCARPSARPQEFCLLFLLLVVVDVVVVVVDLEGLASCKWSSGGTGLLQMIFCHPHHPSHLCQDPDSISRTFLKQFVLIHIVILINFPCWLFSDLTIDNHEDVLLFTCFECTRCLPQNQ